MFFNYDLTHAGKVVLFSEICEGGISSTYEIIYVKTLFSTMSYLGHMNITVSWLQPHNSYSWLIVIY